MGHALSLVSQLIFSIQVTRNDARLLERLAKQFLNPEQLLHRPYGHFSVSSR
jgi:hypothetical protein